MLDSLRAGAALAGLLVGGCGVAKTGPSLVQTVDSSVPDVAGGGGAPGGDGVGGGDVGGAVGAGGGTGGGVVGGAAVVGSGGVGGAGGAGGGSPSAPPLPLDRQLECRGSTQIGGAKMGQCCEHLQCWPARNGVCPGAKDISWWLTAGEVRCSCEMDPVRGPFAVDPSHPLAAQEMRSGPCCYLANYVACEGRPLHVDESVRIAAVVVRSDWC